MQSTLGNLPELFVVLFALQKGEVLVRLEDDDVDELRAGAKLPDEQFTALANIMLRGLDAAAATSSLPEQPNLEKINELMAQMRGIA